MFSIGLMSGTSMDGIDAALLETDGDGFIKELGHTSISYHPHFKILLKSAELAVRKSLGNLNQAKKIYPQMIEHYLKNELKILAINTNHQISQLSAYIHGFNQSNLFITLDELIQHSTELHVSAVKKLLSEGDLTAKDIDVIGYHGQTLFHRPSIGITIQVGDGQYLADQLGITVVNNFRTRDVAAGGQGAPFAPIYHQALAKRDKKIPLAVVNCGGIANISLINSNNELDLIGFDTGPGNALIDRLVRQRTNGAENMDKNGQYGKYGKIDPNVFAALYAKAISKDGKNYLLKMPPKSLDYGDIDLIPELTTPLLSLADACKTLEAFSADTIVNSLDLLQIKIPTHWILAGGGFKNPVIRKEFEERLKAKNPQVKIQSADEAGWHSQALEAQIFAYLAVRSLQNRPISVPGTTNVPEPLSGGHAYLAKTSVTENVKKTHFK